MGQEESSELKDGELLPVSPASLVYLFLIVWIRIRIVRIRIRTNKVAEVEGANEHWHSFLVRSWCMGKFL